METKSLQIVVIDDIAENLKLFKLMLAKVDPENPPQVRAFSSAEDSFLSIRENPPDLILCDERLGGQSGTDFYRELVNYHSQFRAIPFMIISAKNSEKDWRGFYEAGVTDFLPKPVTLERLRFVCRLALWMREVRQKMGVLEQMNAHLKRHYELSKGGKTNGNPEEK